MYGDACAEGGPSSFVWFRSSADCTKVVEGDGLTTRMCIFQSGRRERCEREMVVERLLQVRVGVAIFDGHRGRLPKVPRSGALKAKSKRSFLGDSALSKFKPMSYIVRRDMTAVTRTLKPRLNESRESERVTLVHALKQIPAVQRRQEAREMQAASTR